MLHLKTTTHIGPLRSTLLARWYCWGRFEWLNGLRSVNGNVRDSRNIFRRRSLHVADRKMYESKDLYLFSYFYKFRSQSLLYMQSYQKSNSKLGPELPCWWCIFQLKLSNCFLSLKKLIWKTTVWLNNNSTDIRIARYTSAVTFKCAKKHWSLNISVCGIV